MCSTSRGGTKVGCESDTPTAASGYRYDYKYFPCTVDKCVTCTVSGCTACAPGYFYNSGSCYDCSSNCLECSSGSVCTTCAKSFTLTNNVCRPTTVVDGCEIYSPSGVCLKCDSGKYLLMPDGTQCVACDNSGSGQLKSEGNLMNIFNFSLIAFL